MPQTWQRPTRPKDAIAQNCNRCTCTSQA